MFEPKFYAPVPEDWLVVVADIVGSSQAVADGRYEEVNYLGAACIVAVNNVLGDVSVPSVFGGDGATLAVPRSKRDQVVAALIATQRWGQRAFGLDLRVGVVPIGELKRRGASLEVAKMELSPGNEMAMFRGAGFDLADELVKMDDGAQGFALTVDRDVIERPDLSHLSCRWAPIASSEGVMLCLILSARDTHTERSDAVYREALAAIDGIVALRREGARPVKMSSLKSRVRIAAMRKEAASTAGPLLLRWPRVLMVHLLQSLMFRFQIKLPGFEPLRYQQQMLTNSDFRKVSGKLRLIIDCTVQQADAIEQALERWVERDELEFGSHRASHAIMTCVVPDPINNDHVHYIDGSEGGLWRAASALKKRINMRVTRSRETVSSTQ